MGPARPARRGPIVPQSKRHPARDGRSVVPRKPRHRTAGRDRAAGPATGFRG